MPAPSRATFVHCQFRPSGPAKLLSMSSWALAGSSAEALPPSVSAAAVARASVAAAAPRRGVPRRGVP
ncbi:hypothetical protein [Kitasatospora sp. CB01950]|uniref:hypothetical protein n=1 Tax=Kitasatospora sp. CB01950 TaxID=1703930 RepID=UPI00093F422C